MEQYCEGSCNSQVTCAAACAQNIVPRRDPLQVLSFAHSSGQAIPDSKQETAKLAAAVLVDDQGNYRFAQLPIERLPDPSRKRAQIFPIKGNAIPRDVIAPNGVVLTALKSAAQDGGR